MHSPRMMRVNVLTKCNGFLNTTHRFSSASAVVEVNITDFAVSRKKLRNSRFDNLAMSPTLGLNEMQRMITMDDPKRTIYKFGFGQSPMPVPECLVNKMKEYAHMKDYLPVQGLPQLRKSIADHYNREVLKQTSVSVGNVIVTPGSKQSFFLLKLALSHKTEMLLPSPSWVSYHPQSTMLGRDVKWIMTDVRNGWKMLPQTLEEYLVKNPTRPRMLILNSPSNPTGIKYSEHELAEIAEVCRKYRVIVMSDEIYGDLCHDPNDTQCSIYDVYPEGTIITNGLSKNLGAGGWRLGYMIFPESLNAILDATFVAASETHTSVCAPVQYAACEAFDNFRGDDIQNYLNIKRTVLRALAQKSFDALKGIPGCKVVKPDGGFYIFPDFSNVNGIERLVEQWRSQEGMEDVEWSCKLSSCLLSHSKCEFALFLLNQSGVAGLAGSCFGRPYRELSMRLSYVDFDGSRIFSDEQATTFIAGNTAGDEDMEKFLLKYCGKTIEGMRVLADFMKSI